MALSAAYREKILSRLPPQYRAEYAAGDIDDDILEQFAAEEGIAAPADFSNVRGSPSFANVQATSRSSEDPDPWGYNQSATSGLLGAAADPILDTLGSILGNIAPSFESMAAANTFRSADQGVNPFTDYAADRFGGDPSMSYDFGNSPFTREEIAGASAQDFARARDVINQNTLKAEQTGGIAGRTGADITASLPSFLSMLGGPAAALQAYDQAQAASYAEARLAGLGQDKANLASAGAGGIEAALSLVPSGKLFERLPIGNFLQGRVSNVLGGAAKAGAGEYTNEALTEAANIGFNAALGTRDDDLGAYAQSQAPLDIWDALSRINRAGLAGGVGGAAIGGTATSFQDAAAAGRLAAEALAKSKNDQRMRDLRRIGSEAAQRQQDQERSTAIEPTQGNLFGEPSRELPSFEEQQAQAERDRAFQLQEIETSRARAREREVAFLQREADQLRKNSNAYTLGQDSARLREIDQQIATLTAPAREPFVSEEVTPVPVQGTLDIGRQDIPTVPDLRNQERARRSTAVAQVSETLKRQDTAIQNSAKSKRASDLRTYMQDFLRSNATMPREELVQQAADARLQWENSNPIENYVAQAQTAAQNAPVKAPKTGGKKGKKAKQTKEEKVYDANAKLNELLGLSSQQDNAPATETALSSREATEALVSEIGKGDNRLLAQTLVDGNMEIVNDASEIPSGSVAAGTAGYYDGKKMYVVANQLDRSKPIVGQMMSIATHEVTHAGDVSGNVANALVGTDNNKRLVRQIRELGKTDPKVKALLDKIDAVSGGNEAVKNLETTAYFAQMVEEDNQQSPAAVRLAQNLVSAARTNIKKIMPGDYDVNLNDVAYLARDLLTQAAVDKKNLAGDLQTAIKRYGKKASDPINGLATIAGKKAYAGYQEALRDGRAYFGKVDELVRFEIPDNKAKLKIKAEQFWKENTPRTLVEVLDHPALFEAYPVLEEMIVEFDPTLADSASGAFDKRRNAIQFNPRTAQIEDRWFKETLLHEAQHAIQNIEGFVQGANMEAFVPQAARDAYDKVLDNLDKYVNKFEIGRALKKLSPSMKRTWDMEVRQAEADTLDKQKRLFLREGYYLEVEDRVIQRYGQVYKQKVEEINKARTEYNQIRNRAFAIYLRDYGEAEARNTEIRSRMTDEELSMSSPEETMGMDRFQVPVEQTFDSRQYLQNPAAAPLPVESADPEAEVEGLASMTDDSIVAGRVEELTQKAPRAVKRILYPGSGFGQELGELLRHAANLPASLAIRGTHFGNEFLTELQTHANLKRMKLPEFREMIGKKIDAIDEMDSLDQRKSAMAALDREYPGLGRKLEAMREFKWQLTQDLINQRRRDPKPMTEKEVALYQKMIQNRERYTTRAYLATYNPEVGRAYGEYILKQYNLDPTSAEGKIVADALNYLVDNELTVPDTETLESMKMPQLRRIYEAWVGDASKFKGKQGRKAMVAALDAIDPKTREEIDAKAMEVVRDMLGLDGKKGRIARQFTPSMRQNRTILNARTDIPPELRKLLGEITDPFLRESISLQRMINLSAKTKFLTEVMEQGEGKWYANEKSEKFATQINSPSYGAMDGKWISQDLEDAITGSILSLNNIDTALSDMVKEPDFLMQAVLGAAIPAANRIMSIQKTWNVVASAFNMAMNLVGAVALMGPSQGIINPKTYAKGMSGAAKTLTLEVTDRVQPESWFNTAEELTRAGVVDSATMGEFKSQAYQSILRELNKLNPDAPGYMRKAVSLIGKEIIGTGGVANSLRQAYAFMDVWVKVATYYDRKNFLTQYSKLEGTNWTDEEIQRRAGYEAAGTNISYERAIPAAKILERNIPVFMFLTYFSEVPRAMSMSLVQGVSDLNLARNSTNPKAKALAATKGMLRITGTLAVNGGIIAATLAALDSEDEEEKLRRRLDADYMQDVWQIPLGKDADGNEVRFSVNRVDPNGPLNELIVKMASSEDPLEAAVQGVWDLFVPSNGFLAATQIVTDAAVAAVATATGKEAFMELDRRRKKDGLTERNYPNAYKSIKTMLSAGDVGENVVAAVEALFLPSSLRPALDDKGEVVSDRQWLGDIPRQLGARAYVRDPDKSLSFRAMDYSDKLDILKKEKADLIASGTLDPDTIKDLRDREYEAFNDMVESYEGYLAYEGRTHAKAADLLNNKTLSNALRTGRFKSTITDASNLDEWKKRELKKAGADKQEINQQYRLMKQLFSEVN